MVHRKGRIFEIAIAVLCAVGISSPSWSRPAYDKDMVKIQVRLARANFSPGAIDGHDGPNVRRAIAAYAQAHGLKSAGELNRAVRLALRENAAPEIVSYEIKTSDVQGPFVENSGHSLEDLSRLPYAAYSDAAEALAEKFHMSKRLLQQMNAEATFNAGDTIKVVDVRSVFANRISRIEINRTSSSVFAFDEKANLIGFFPATIGGAISTSPSESLRITGVIYDPAYYYDAGSQTFSVIKRDGALEIASGPNNPLGAAWIGLSRGFCGIHGSAEPRLVGNPSDEGCVQMTNWDVRALAKALASETEVVFEPTT